MIERCARTIFVLSTINSILGDVASVTIVDQYPNKEYIIEHQVTYNDAVAEARNLKIYRKPIPGCEECTTAEMTYCKDESVLNDHCCCEGSYNKVFPFVEHICRVSRQPCKVIAGDCAAYTRLRECCCHSYLASLWKYMAGGATTQILYLPTIIGVLIVVENIRLILFQ